METQFERMNSVNVPSVKSLKDPVVLNDDVYTLGHDWHTGDGKLYKYSPSSNEWSEYAMSQSVYATHSILTTYRSKLLLISGKDMSIWEFSVTDLAFKKSCIGPLPQKLARDEVDRRPADYLIATSRGDYLIIMDSYLTYELLVFDGKSWTSRWCHKTYYYDGFHSGYKFRVVISAHTAIVVAFSDWGDVVRMLEAPLTLHLKDEDTSSNSHEVDVISSEEFNELVCTARSTIINNENIYFVDSHGVVFTSFIQPPIIPLVWGRSGVNFQQAPCIAGLSDGTLLLIGTVKEKHGSTLDVIKVKQQGIL